MTLRFVPLVLCSLALLACGGSVAVTGTGGGGSGGSEGGAGGSGGSGGAGGSCTRTNHHFAYTLTPTGGTSIDCNSMQPGGSTKAHIEGVVIKTTPTDLAIDTCPPNADCDVSAVYNLAADSPGFVMDVPAGTFVQIDVLIDFPWGCANTIMARNLPSWGGLVGPGGDVPSLLFEGSEGASQALDGSPFSLASTALGCHPDAEPGCGKEDEFRFDVTSASGVLPVYQGETKAFDVIEGGALKTLLFRNLKSFETGWCDDYWNWAYWAVPAPLPN